MGRGVQGVAGGIGGLHRLLTEHGGAVERDLLCAGLRRDDLGTERLTWRDLLVFVRYSPPESALARVQKVADPDSWVTADVQLLREIEHGVRVLAWMQTDDGHKRPELQRNYPERIPLTEAERAEYDEKHGPEYDAMTLTEAADFLGWKRPKQKGA